MANIRDDSQFRSGWFFGNLPKGAGGSEVKICQNMSRSCQNLKWTLYVITPTCPQKTLSNHFKGPHETRTRKRAAIESGKGMKLKGVKNCVETSEMDLSWCIFMTNNLESCWKKSMEGSKKAQIQCFSNGNPGGFCWKRQTRENKMHFFF